MKLDSKQKKQLSKTLPHITGECMCPASSKTCVYWKNVEKGVGEWQTKLIIKEIEKL